MRIGILTLPLNTNYGGLLQAYALQTVLERMGHNVVVFNTNGYNFIPLWKMPIKYLKRIVKKLIGRKSVIFYEQRFNKEYPIVSEYTQPFIDKYIHSVSVKDFKRLNKDDYDAIVVGSDQIWRPMYCLYIKSAYLQFAANWDIKRIAYAVSFGVDYWEYNRSLTRCCAELARKFDAVSVRENSGIKLCRNYLNIEARHVLDPTMLLNKEDYIKLVENAATRQREGDFACYILDMTIENQQFISVLATEECLSPFYINSRVDDWSAPLEKRIQPPVEKWLRGFLDAKFVVTDSFHSCVFSILFNKPFVVIGNENRGVARIKSLLAMFCLENNMYSDTWCYEDSISVNWEMINEKLKEWRVLSSNFLKAHFLKK
ncbi:MAG: polysaccharide pyruvyl transferase family protein [Prevotella sp.]|nr:polysaccharide pyruvyl transferase family protein [Prevotella sp.]